MLWIFLSDILISPLFVSQKRISTIMTYAQRNQIIMMNPCKNVVIPRLERKEIECYTLEQAQKMLELFEQEPQEDLKFTVFFTLAMYSGMRRGELLGLE
ncbi:MAG: hypothetical protein K6F27_00580 [Ruminococcus sp.]|nr:hypothetical protein [Ruminococcus sp.]